MINIFREDPGAAVPDMTDVREAHRAAFTYLRVAATAERIRAADIAAEYRRRAAAAFRLAGR